MELVVIGSLAGVAVVALVGYTLVRMKPGNDAAADHERKQRAAMATSITLGAAVGAGLSAALDISFIGMGVAIGVAVGVAIGVSREQKQKLR
jgi:predicted MFS family arabinose efflux permease